MMSPGASANGYREHLSRWSSLLAGGRVEEFQAELASNPVGVGARTHLANSVGERRRLLREELGLVALAVPDIDVVIDTFIQAAPRPAFDLEYNDAERFLRWLRDTRSLTPQQTAFVGYQLGEYAVLTLARRDRAGHVRFQQLLRTSERPEGLERRGIRPRLHLNPIRIWQQSVAPESIPDHQQETPHVLFFAAGGEVRVLALEPGHEELVRKLEELAPCRLDEWQAHSGHADGIEHELTSELVRQGVVALAE